MRIILKVLMLFLAMSSALYANSYEQIDVNLKADFYIQKANKKSSTKNYTYNFSLFHDIKKTFKQNSYCFFGKKMVNFSKKVKKAKFKMCLNEDGTKYIYSLSESFRYVPAKKFKVMIKNIDLKIINNTTNAQCDYKVNSYKGINQKINECIVNF